MSMFFPEGISIRWLGHSFFEINASGQSFLIDPFYTSNPAFPKIYEKEILRTGAYQAVLQTHAHGDHFEGALPLLKNDPALKIICQFEISLYLQKKGITPTQLLGMNTGGTIQMGTTRITMVPAVHTNSITEDGETFAIGVAVGYVIRFANGFTIYNTGDTAVTFDMQLIADLYKPNLVILPIGDFYTMGPEQAAYALKLLQPDFAVPCHYGTWDGKPPGTPEALQKELETYHIKTQLLTTQPGDLLQ